MKIAIVTDTHTGARSESETFNNYFITFFEQVFFPYLEQNNIDTVIHLGDVFDRRKYINFKILDTWNERVFPRLAKYDTHIILGNHDIYYKNTSAVDSVTQLLKPYNFKVYKTAEEVKFGNLPILFLPWINPDNTEHTFNLLNNTKTEIAMGHLEIKGFEMFAGQMNHDHGLEKNIFKQFDLCLSGHFHHKSDDGSIYYLGSPYPMTWADYGDRRGFHIFDTETRELEFIENPYQIFHKIYYDDTNKSYSDLMAEDLSFIQGMYVKVIVENKTNPYFFEQYIDKLNQNNPSNISVVEASFESTNVEDEIDQTKDTLTLLTEYVESMDIEYKKELVKVLRNLYSEAVAVDNQIG